MARIIRSPAFPAGYVSMTPFDPEEAYFSDHANLFSWISGAGLTLREIDSIWDDLAKPTLSYHSPGGPVAGAKPSAAINGRPSIRIGAPNAHLVGSQTIPASFTVATTFKLDVPASGATQVLLTSSTSAFPRAVLAVQAAGYLQYNHNAPPDSVAAVGHGVIPANSPCVGWASYDGATNAARVGLNKYAAGGSGTFTDDHAAVAGITIGGHSSGGSNIVGDIGDMLIFNSVLSDADRARLLAFLGRRAGVTISDLPA